MVKFSVPAEVAQVGEKLISGNFQAYLVGGCVRDLLFGRKPNDWDIATDAKPEEIQKLFPESVYENKFGTVLVKCNKQQATSETRTTNPMSRVADKHVATVEVTTFRLEGKYTDKRHPDEVKFAETVEEDLSRRDFTINAIALNLTTKNYQLKTDVVDPYGGEKDLKAKIIRTVGNPKERFSEDALRLFRAVRFAVDLDFELEGKTAAAIKSEAGLLEMIAKERIRDEFLKMIMTPRAAKGIILLEDLGLLRYVIPELREGIGVSQERHHIYTVFDHSVRSLNYAVEKEYSLEVRLASFLHDVGKPRTRQGEHPPTFHNHEIVGARMATQILDRLRFPKEVIERTTRLVRYHMFYYNVGEVTEAGVRRFLSRVGAENISDLIKVREADRIGSGVPKAVPYKLRHLLFMIEKVKHDPIHPKMLTLKGDDVMKLLDIPSGPKVGYILSILLEEVLDDPRKNTKENLESRIKNLAQLQEDELKTLALKARERKDEFESGIEAEIKKKFHV